MWHILLCRKVCIYIPILFVKVGQEIHEKVINDIRLVALSQGVQIEPATLQAMWLCYTIVQIMDIIAV